MQSFRILRYLVREFQKALHHTLNSAFFIAQRVALITILEVCGGAALFVGFSLGFQGCTPRHTLPTTSTTDTTQQDTLWHTCLIRDAQATLTLDEQVLEAACTMQTIRDSLITLSIMPLLGFELFRIEATPQEIAWIDKVNQQYITTDYNLLNRYLTPSIDYTLLQQIATAELPTIVQQTVRIGFTLGNQAISIRFNYPERRLNVPVRSTRIQPNRYQNIDLQTLLPESTTLL